MEANAAPRNGQNHMPMRGNRNNDYGAAIGQHYGSSSTAGGATDGHQVGPEESNQSEINDESQAVDPEFASLTDDGSPESAASNSEADESDEPSSSSLAAAAAGVSGFGQPAIGPNSWLGSGNTNSRSGSSSSSSDADELDEEPRGQDSNIANAKIKLSSTDMSTAAGHHYHGHGVHGWLEMGAHTGKKGAFGWHDKHPVGGKGRR